MTPRATLTGTTASIAGLVNDKTYYCAVTAVNLSGGEKKEVIARSAAPEGDKEGPTISDVRFDNEPVVNGMVLRQSGSFNLTAADPSGMSRVEFRFDGALYRTATTATPRYTCTCDVAQVPDGDHLLIITAYDTLGNASTLTYNLTVALNPPQPPTVIYPLGGQLVNVAGITVSGRAESNAEVLVFDNNLASEPAARVDAIGSFSLPDPVRGRKPPAGSRPQPFGNQPPECRSDRHSRFDPTSQPSQPLGYGESWWHDRSGLASTG